MAVVCLRERHVKRFYLSNRPSASLWKRACNPRAVMRFRLVVSWPEVVSPNQGARSFRARARERVEQKLVAGNGWQSEKRAPAIRAALDFSRVAAAVSAARLTSGDYERRDGEANELVICCRRVDSLCAAYVSVRFRKAFRIPQRFGEI